MEQEYVQQDLFEGEYNKKKAKKPPIFANYQKRSRLPYLKVPVEHLVVAVIGVLVLALLSYAVGVEVGRRNYPEKEVGAKAIGKEPVPADMGDMVRGETVQEPVKQMTERRSETPAGEKGEKVPERSSVARVPETEKETPDADDTEGADLEEDKRENGTVYIVQIASFRDRPAAEKLVADLKARGLSARHRKSGNWYQVYAEGYGTIVQARKARSELITRYPDCYIKRKR